MAKYNKAWAAAVAQALVQLVVAFAPFEPELEQALGVVLTAAIVWLVPNAPPAGPRQPPSGSGATTASTANLPVWTMAVALMLGLLVSGCAALGDKTADALLGADCGPASRAYRAEVLTERLLARYPSAAAEGLKQAVAQMRAAADAGAPMDAAAVAYQAALASAVGPVIGATAGQPVLLQLSLLPGAAQDFLIVRSQLGAFCAGQPQ